MDELVVKVPAPYFGVENVGFSARYPSQPRGEPLRDVTVFVEGPADPMRRLVGRLRLLAEKDLLVPAAGADDEMYSWSAPIELTDEACVLAFRDRSVNAAQPSASAATPAHLRGYVWNLVRPLAFTFLRDCVRLGDLRLSESILMILDPGRPPLVDVEVERSAISTDNGTVLLYA